MTGGGRDHPQGRTHAGTELLISRVLRTGVLLSSALVVLGTVVTFVHHSEYFTSSGQLPPIRDGALGFPTTVTALVHGLGQFEGRAIVSAGLVVLVATPILRVAISILAFARVGDRLFAAITSFVLLLLVTSLVLGRAGG